jgi:ketosteroid isomerase-like protein
MAAIDDLDEVVGQYQLAAGEFVKGNSEPAKKLFSHREDVTLANPQGPAVRGWAQFAQTMERAASARRDGEATSFEILAKYVTPELAYVVEVERFKAKVGGKEDITPFALRATMVFRPEDGV